MRLLFTRMLCSALVLFWLWLAGFAWFFTQLPAKDAAPPPEADAIVALTGWGGRIEQALAYLAAEKAPVLFISGMETRMSPQDIATRAEEAAAAALRGQEAQRIALGYEARNTIGNAMEVAGWLHDNPHARLILVTSDFHMPRAIREFRYQLPGHTIYPASVTSNERKKNPLWWLQAPYRGLLFSEYHKTLAAILRHWLISVAA